MQKIFIILGLLLIMTIVLIIWRHGMLTSISQFSSQEELVNQAIALQLPDPQESGPNDDKAKMIATNAHKKVTEGHYGKALETAFNGVNQIPNNFTLQTEFAVLLGDYESHFSSPLKERMIKRSQEIFENLYQHHEKQPKLTQHWFLNEYFFRNKKFKEQYELGLTRVSTFWNTPDWTPRGYYSQGVGAAQYARELLNAGNTALAKDYAQKALVAWAQYFSYKNNYYNAYVHYSLALGILGYHDAMIKALERGAELIKSDLNFPEFKDIIDFVNTISRITA